MFGFLFGTLCFVALMGLVARPRCHGRMHHERHRGFHRGPGGRGRRHGRGRGKRGFGRAAGEVFKRKLDVDEDQEDLIDHALGDLRSAFKGFGSAMKDGRADLAQAFAGDEVDDAALAALWAQQDEEIARLRREAVSALKQVHAVLDSEQRETASGWLQHRGAWA